MAADLLLHGPVTAADPAISTWLREHAQPAATWVLEAITRMHSTVAISIMSALLAAFLVAARRASDVAWMLVTVQGGQLLNYFVKGIFHRTRPHWDGAALDFTGASFPSGHASGSAFFWSFALMLLWAAPVPPWARRTAAAFAVAMVALTALSRVYLGAHYLSDVLAGIGEGVAWASLWAWVRISCRSRARRPSPNRAA